MKEAIVSPGEITALLQATESLGGEIYEAEPLYDRFGYPNVYGPDEDFEDFYEFENIHELMEGLSELIFPVRLKYRVEEDGPVKERIWWMPLLWINHFFPDGLPRRILDYREGLKAAEKNPHAPLSGKPALFLYATGWSLDNVKKLIGTREEFAALVKSVTGLFASKWPYGVDRSVWAYSDLTTDQILDLEFDVRRKAPKLLAADLETVRRAMLSRKSYYGDKEVTMALNRLCVALLNGSRTKRDPSAERRGFAPMSIYITPKEIKRIFGDNLERPRFWRWFGNESRWYDVDPVRKATRLYENVIEGENRVREAILDFAESGLFDFIRGEVYERYSWGRSKRSALSFMMERLFYVDERRKIIGARKVKDRWFPGNERRPWES